MSHPQPDQWVQYMADEAAPEERRALEEHLRTCHDCSARLAAWRRTVRRLDHWTLPKRRKRLATRLELAIKWAVAAGIVLGFGIAVGRWTAPAVPRAEVLRAEIDAAVSRSVARQMQEVWSAELESRLAASRRTSTAEMQRQAKELLGAVHAALDQEHRATQSQLQEVRDQQAADYLSLRRDLETVAALTDDQIQRTRRTLLSLAADTQGRPAQPQ